MISFKGAYFPKDIILYAVYFPYVKPLWSFRVAEVERVNSLNS